MLPGEGKAGDRTYRTDDCGLMPGFPGDFFCQLAERGLIEFFFDRAGNIGEYLIERCAYPGLRTGEGSPVKQASGVEGTMYVAKCDFFCGTSKF